ncbi:hypothetical protein DM860_006718 [Cuscuta australis]|uniref:Choline kinase N-terminal domain-containing protein n=1 Tax=Cuscuta australis TaxID=267555 RepID=A0A328D851_9ASTE|nr:hypothetical protein DM860_006718 [Cuscuta australis]
MAVKKKGCIEGGLPEGLQKLLLSLALKWGDVLLDDEGDLVGAIKVKHLSGAMTNEVYQISWPAKMESLTRKVLVRVYGEGVDLFFDRDGEIRTFECLSSKGYGPKLLGQFPQGRIEEFIHARTLSAGDLRDPKVSSLIAAKLREFHDLDMPGPKEVVLWDRLRNWLEKAKSLCSTEDIKEFGLEDLEDEIGFLENEISREAEEEDIVVGFCHNDLQYGNIMIDDDANCVTLIDYEYASYNPIAYDFANHFCEMAADYHTETPHVLDYTRYPGQEERHRFIRSYLGSAGNHPRRSNEEVEKLADLAEKYTLANHLFWGLWGIISAYVNNIGFDYLEYARQRFQQYSLRKPQLLK